MRKDPLDLFGRRIEKAKKYLKLKNNSVIVIFILVLLTGCFFYIQNCDFGIKAKSQKSGEDKILLEKYASGFFCKSAERENNPKIRFSGELTLNNNLCLKNIENKPLELKKVEEGLYAMVSDYPIEEMVPYIAKYKRETAALIIGIAKKESNWGKRSPSKNGKTCYNYWGYKGAGSRGLAMGYGCFTSPQESVEIVGGRIDELVGKKMDTPSKMVVWKCGSSCAATGGEAAARKWISDVDIYFRKIVIL